MTAEGPESRSFTSEFQPCSVRLTPKEDLVAHKILKGKSNRQIAEEMGVSINTIKTHVANILKKEQVKNRIQLISNQFNKP